VCPLSVLQTWQDEVQAVCPQLSVWTYHGPDRSAGQGFGNYDIVLTTYAMVTVDAKKGSGICKVRLARVVLDEAHCVKSRTSHGFKAVCALAADIRWCLTGTPIQNKLEYIFAYLRFLRVEPLSDYAWFNRAVLRPLQRRAPMARERLQALLKHIFSGAVRTCK
jgi:DNA repair protein RAD5